MHSSAQNGRISRCESTRIACWGCDGHYIRSVASQGLHQHLPPACSHGSQLCLYVCKCLMHARVRVRDPICEVHVIIVERKHVRPSRHEHGAPPGGPSGCLPLLWRLVVAAVKASSVPACARDRKALPIIYKRCLERGIATDPGTAVLWTISFGF